MSPSADTPLLQLAGITKSFGGVHALRGVEFTLHASEIHALLGENGAGKSTLIKIVAGAHQPDSGEIRVHGVEVPDNSPAVSRELGIAVIYQQPALFADLTVAENIGLRSERSGPTRRVDWRRRTENARSLLARVGAQFSPETEVRDLSMPQQQLVEIAAALGCDARILILDEPTASLSEQDAQNLFTVLAGLRRDGVGIVYISHRLDEVLQIADRLTVLRDGAYVTTRETAGATREEIVRLMVGRSLDTVFHKATVPIGDVVLEARNLGCSISGVRDVNMSVRAGEILGLAGLVGAGRTELARVLFGLTPADSGEIRIAGKPVTFGSPADAVRAGIAYVPEDRRRHGVILEMGVDTNTTLAVLGQISQNTLLDFAKEHALASEYVTRLQTKVSDIESSVAELSGGNQQKVALARWLATKPRVILLDEPTQGVDVGAKAEIHRLIADLARDGLAVVLISSELPEVLGVSDRIAVLRAGTIVATLDRADATPERVLDLALHGIPTAAGNTRA